MRAVTRYEYMAAMRALGILADIGEISEFDVQAAELLHVRQRTARRYRLGTSAIPGPVEVALRALMQISAQPSNEADPHA